MLDHPRWCVWHAALTARTHGGLSHAATGHPGAGAPLGDRRPEVEVKITDRGPYGALRHHLEIHREETPMVTTVCYKVIDLSPHSDAWPADMEDVLNEQAQEGWELVTGFERTHEALQVGSTTGPVPGLVSTVLVFKRADAL